MVFNKLAKSVLGLVPDAVSTQADRYFNANHRHDEAHEIEADNKREAEKMSHRFVYVLYNQ